MLSVLMATYNGVRTLPTVLDAYCALEPPPGDWKLIIVDNGSTDESKKLIRSFAEKLPLTYLFEPKRGKNVALNTGLSHIEGDLVVCTDDDTIPRLDWLTQLRAVADSRPSFSIFGGIVLPRWEVNPEPWVLRWVPLDVTYALTNPSWEEGPTTPLRIFEPNSAYRAHIFEAGYKFDPAIGPSGSNYAMGSGSELHLRLMKAGFTAWHCKSAIVEHIVRRSQMDKDWVLGRAFRHGRGHYRQDLHNTVGATDRFLGIPRSIVSDILTQALRVARTRLSKNDFEIFTQRWNLNFLIGQAYEARMIHRHSGQSKSIAALQ